MVPKKYHLKDHCMDTSQISHNAISVIKTLKHHGYQAFLVGGCIRDLLLGQAPKDFDISTSAKPEEIKSIFKNCILIGRRFRLAHVRFGSMIIEVSTFRSGKNDEDTLITRDNDWGNPEEDVLRRDFTVNGLFYDPCEDVIIDYTAGFEDIKNRVLKTIGIPSVRFKQDPVRMIRMLKILSRFEFNVEPDTLNAFMTHQEEIFKSSPSRVFDEIIKMLLSGSATNFFKTLNKTDFLKFIFSDLYESFKNKQILQMTIDILTYLDAISSSQHATEKSFLLSVLIWPTLEAHIQKLSKEEESPLTSTNSISSAIGTYINNFFYHNSFAKCPKKIAHLIIIILTSQYKLTPLCNKKPRYNHKLVKQPYFIHSILLLKLRCLLDNKLFNEYNFWKTSLKKSSKKKQEHSDHIHKTRKP